MAKKDTAKEGWQRPKTSFGDTFTFTKKDETLEGLLMSKREGVGPYGSNAYGILCGDAFYTLWGSVNLDMQVAEVPEGSRIRIKYLGESENPKTGRKFHQFEVLYIPPKEVKTASVIDEEIPF